MVLRRHTLVLTALLLLTQTTAAVADDTNDWRSGQQAFAAEDYAAALHFFRSTRDSGLQSPAVHYNIAVCQFKLGDYVAARQTFQLIADSFPRMRGLAEYNMGLSERRLGNNYAAQRHFIDAYRLSADDDKLRSLSAAVLQELESEEPATWFGSIGLRVGNDDNVALRDSLGLPAGVTSESPMADLFATISGPVPKIRGLTLDGSAYVIKYADAENFDQSELRVGAAYVWHSDDWRIEGSGHFAHGTLGGAEFNQEGSLGARLVRRLGTLSTLVLRYRYDDIDAANSNFPGIAGSRQRLDLGYRWAFDDRVLLVRYGHERNDRLDAGVSPTRTRFRADYRSHPESGWGYEAGMELRNSDYDDLAAPRDEDLYVVSVALTRAVTIDWRIMLQYRLSDNHSSDPEFSYTRNQITLGVFYLF